MNTHKRFLFSTLLLLIMSAWVVSCTQDETDMGLDLQDPLTLYHGKRGTIHMTAATFCDDSLSTVGYSAGVFGNAMYQDLGAVEAVLYSQISIANSTGIALSDDVTIDSVKMTLVIDTLYPIQPDSTVRRVHIRMMQLAEPLNGDSNYRATASIPDGNTCFFDGEADYLYGSDSMVLTLDTAIYSVLKQTCSRDDFHDRTKGFSLRLAPDAQTLITVNLAATNTRITLYYHTSTAEDLKYNFVINSGAVQFMHYDHDFTGTVLQPLANNSGDSIDGSRRLYLLPLGGTKVRMNWQPFIDTFRVNHPTATIHYAELVLPVAPEGDTSRAARLMALKINDDGTLAYVTDANVLTNPYTYSGFDGRYHADKGYYRLRVTQHLQELLRTGKDHGTELIIDARRSTAFPAMLNGTEDGNPIHIDFIYTE